MGGRDGKMEGGREGGSTSELGGGGERRIMQMKFQTYMYTSALSIPCS